MTGPLQTVPGVRIEVTPRSGKRGRPHLRELTGRAWYTPITSVTYWKGLRREHLDLDTSLNEIARFHFKKRKKKRNLGLQEGTWPVLSPHFPGSPTPGQVTMVSSSLLTGGGNRW